MIFKWHRVFIITVFMFEFCCLLWKFIQYVFCRLFFRLNQASPCTFSEPRWGTAASDLLLALSFAERGTSVFCFNSVSFVHMPAPQNEAVITGLNWCGFTTSDDTSEHRSPPHCTGPTAVVCTIFLQLLIAIMVNPMGTMELYQQNAG